MKVTELRRGEMPVYEPYPGSQTALRLSPYKDTDSWLCRSSLKGGKSQNWKVKRP